MQQQHWQTAQQQSKKTRQQQSCCLPQANIVMMRMKMALQLSTGQQRMAKQQQCTGC
jgi:hypothetical protein